ncbi:MAG: hypothetical protein IID31_05070 [Planctomycetes bacterium]|nr:hypothetical protein [Planctomycetota bacterium]
MDSVQLQPDEIVYRRIAFVHFPPSEKQPQVVAFTPHPNDDTGISLWRERFITAEEVAQKRPDRRCHVAKMLVRDLNSLGLTVIADDPDNDPAHAIIPELRRAVYLEDRDKGKAIANRIITEVAEVVYTSPDPNEARDTPDHAPSDR